MGRRRRRLSAGNSLLLTSPLMLPSKKPRPGTLSSKVHGTFYNRFSRSGKQQIKANGGKGCVCIFCFVFVFASFRFAFRLGWAYLRIGQDGIHVVVGHGLLRLMPRLPGRGEGWKGVVERLCVSECWFVWIDISRVVGRVQARTRL